MLFLLDIGDNTSKYDVALHYAYSYACAADYAGGSGYRDDFIWNKL